MAIVDGQFLRCLSVGHAEIRLAIAKSWQVWGLSSMGAIRACEMKHLGMRGYGEVYQWYCRDECFRDDEVALMHRPNPPYDAVSEPLIHIRVWLQELVKNPAFAAWSRKSFAQAVDVNVVWRPYPGTCAREGSLSNSSARARIGRNASRI